MSRSLYSVFATCVSDLSKVHLHDPFANTVESLLFTIEPISGGSGVHLSVAEGNGISRSPTASHGRGVRICCCRFRSLIRMGGGLPLLVLGRVMLAFRLWPRL